MSEKRSGALNVATTPFASEAEAWINLEGGHVGS
jgi:hypothetical protein